MHVYNVTWPNTSTEDHAYSIAKIDEMAGEVLYLASTLLSGAYIAWSVGEYLSLHYMKHQLTPYASLCPLWSALFVVPIFIFVRTRHFWLRGTRIHSCEPAMVYPHRDPVLGTDWLKDMTKITRANRLLEVWDGLYARLGNTFWVQNIGVWILMTNEPENIKTMLASEFETWAIGGPRQKISVLALGPHAIFAVNGAEWQHARAMIRPSFVRNQIADLECTERHVENFLGRMPKDGSAVDLQDLLYKFTMDVATDFM